MRKLILRTVYSAGDVVMLTAAVRDLHGTYPGQFLTDVRTRCAELWEHNPYVTPGDEADPGVELIECDYPLINRCERAACHCLHGFIEFLNQRLGLAIQCTAFHGDLHLSALEKSWYSQVYELVGRELPFWLVVAGGKYDVTIKWWSTERFQAVVDHFRGRIQFVQVGHPGHHHPRLEGAIDFRGRIQFVQVGHPGHHHPRLEGAIDLRGETNPRELVRLVYHAQGVLCPVTAVMHLAAAVEVKGNRPPHRPCVVVAGGREPAPWEAYPFHQFIHTVGSLPCCAQGGCWRDRTLPLGDGDERDGPDRLCLAVRNGLPRCMDLITAAEVIRRIELYFQGGVVRYLTADEAQAARRGVAVTADRRFDQLPLTLSGARLACERFEQRISTYPKRYGGRGIVICAGGVKYFTCAWVCLNMLRRLGCTLPVQLWYLGKEELDDDMRALVAPLGAECVDAHRLRKRWPMRRLGGWELKPYAMVHSPFQEVLFLDADNVPVVNPEYLFETPEYREHGAIFWPDYGQFERTAVVWQSCGLPRPAGPEFESGQLLVDKQRCWRALNLALWFNAHSDFYYQYLHGDKETFHLAFRKTQTPFALVPVPIQPLVGTMCQHDFQGRRVFQHRNTDKWDLFLPNAATTCANSSKPGTAAPAGGSQRGRERAGSDLAGTGRRALPPISSAARAARRCTPIPSGTSPAPIGEQNRRAWISTPADRQPYPRVTPRP